MIRRKQAKIITPKEFLADKPKQIVSCDIEDILCGDYVYILDSMDMEDFDYDDTSFDLFKEIVYENKVVGFVSYYTGNSGNQKLMEFYVMPEYRGNNLLYDEISSKENLSIRNPKIAIVKALIDCNMATELSDGIVVSEIPFNVSYELVNDRDMSDYFSHIYDLNNGSVLLLEDPSSFNYSRPNRTDENKYDLKDNIDNTYLNNVREIVSNHDEKYLKVSSEKFKLNVVFV